MLFASKKIKNLSTLETDIGIIEFVVPDMVIEELHKISRQDNLKKKISTEGALQLVQNFKKIKISGNTVDEALVSYVKTHGGIIATVDIDLKKRIKKFGGSVLSFTNDRIILEPSKI